MPKGGLKNSKLVDKKFKNRFTFLIWRLLSKINARNGVFSIQNERNPPNLNYIWTKQSIKKFRSLFLYTTFIILLFSHKLGGLLSLFWFIIKNIFHFRFGKFCQTKNNLLLSKKATKKPPILHKNKTMFTNIVWQNRPYKKPWNWDKRKELSN